LLKGKEIFQTEVSAAEGSVSTTSGRESKYAAHQGFPISPSNTGRAAFDGS
jgi:hypothetical protein